MKIFFASNFNEEIYNRMLIPIFSRNMICKQALIIRSKKQFFFY